MAVRAEPHRRPASDIVQPPTPPPSEAPPAPPVQPPSAPQTQPIERHVEGAPPSAPPALAQEGPAGQWVYTHQYGWVWMPYEEAYTYVVPESAVGYMYVYGPVFGWSWVVAPWVFGLGPMPFWGPLGAAHFHWYAHPVRPGAPFHGPSWQHGGFGGGFRRGGRP